MLDIGVLSLIITTAGAVCMLAIRYCYLSKCYHVKIGCTGIEFERNVGMEQSLPSQQQPHQQQQSESLGITPNI